jgi:hypothetical protein
MPVACARYAGEEAQNACREPGCQADAVGGDGQRLGVGVREPQGWGGGRGGKVHRDTALVEQAEHLVHAGEVQPPRLGFDPRPGEDAERDQVDPGLAHQRHVLAPDPRRPLLGVVVGPEGGPGDAPPDGVRTVGVRHGGVLGKACVRRRTGAERCSGGKPAGLPGPCHGRGERGRGRHVPAPLGRSARRRPRRARQRRGRTAGGGVQQVALDAEVQVDCGSWPVSAW